MLDPGTKATQTLVEESETDIMIVCELDDGTRVGILIENKAGPGKFRPNRVDSCAQRARAWVGSERYGNYSQWGTVPVTPEAFRACFPEDCAKFDSFISHEDIALFVPLCNPAPGNGWLAAVQSHFDELVRSTVASYPGVEPITPPALNRAEIASLDKTYLAVNGMYGGFAYWLDETVCGGQLIVESWSRVVEGSGLRHSITPEGLTLLDSGFV